MTSSVAVRLRWKARRIWCCLASSREKTVIWRGSPASPVSRRLTRTLPSEPVPPVTTTLLSLGSMNPPNLFVRRRVVAHAPDHLRPRGRADAGLAAEARAVEAAVTDERLVRLDADAQPVNLLDQGQQVELADRPRGHVPDAAQVPVLAHHLRDHFGERPRSE